MTREIYEKHGRWILRDDEGSKWFDTKEEAEKATTTRQDPEVEEKEVGTSKEDKNTSKEA